MILVCGATGNVGGEIVRQLSAGGVPAAGVLRRPDAPLPPGIDRVVGDLGDPDSLAGALSTAEAVFVMPGYDGLDRLLAHAASSGVQRVVLLSGGGAVAGDVDNPLSQFQLASEAAVRRSTLDWTILQPYGFMSNTLEWTAQLRNGDVIRAPFADVAVAMIDPADIATCAIQTLRGHVTGGGTYRLSGPAPLRPADRVRILGQTLGRALRFEVQGDDRARAEMLAQMPEGYVDAFFSFAHGALDESRPVSTVADLTGIQPRTFEQWTLEHRHELSGAPLSGTSPRA